MITIRTVSAMLMLLLFSCASRTSEEQAATKAPPVEQKQGPYIKELTATTRVETTAHWPKDWAARAGELAAFAAEFGARIEGPLVALDVLLPDMVDSVQPRAELVYSVTGPDDLPEGGEGMALLKVKPCKVVAMGIKGSHHDVLGALGELVQWAKEHGHDIELRPGVILHDPAMIERGGAMEIFYPVRQSLKAGEFSFCSPGLGSQQ